MTLVSVVHVWLQVRSVCQNNATDAWVAVTHRRQSGQASTSVQYSPSLVLWTSCILACMTEHAEASLLVWTNSRASYALGMKAAMKASYVG